MQLKEKHHRKELRVIMYFIFSLFSSPEENAYDEYENELGITAIALYDYQAGEQSSCFSPFGFENSVLHETNLNFPFAFFMSLVVANEKSGIWGFNKSMY